MVPYSILTHGRGHLRDLAGSRWGPHPRASQKAFVKEELLNHIGVLIVISVNPPRPMIKNTIF